MNIAQVVSCQENVPPKNKNGLEFLVSFLTEGLVKRGHNVTLFAPKTSKTSAKKISIVPKAVSNSLTLSRWGGLVSGMNFAKCAGMSNKFDIIHSHLGEHAHLFSSYCKAPIVETLHSPICNSFENIGRKKQFKGALLEYNNLTKNVWQVFVSNNQRKLYKNPKKSFVVHNAIPVSDFGFSDKVGGYFAYLGYLNSEKGADSAVKIAKKMNIKLNLAGNVTDYFYKKYIKKYLSSKIKYVGPLSYYEKIKFLKNARALIAPIKWDEPFGLVFIEALACGTPVIAYNKGAVSEIIKNKKNGYVVSDRKGFYNAIKNIDKIDRYVCRKSALDDFDIERMIDDYEAVYEKIASSYKRV